MPDDHNPEVGPQWFSVRSHYRFIGEFGQNIYEERVVLFQAEGADDAIRQAESEAADYCDGPVCDVLPMFQSFRLFDDVGPQGEVYSLMRESELDPEPYIDQFFDTGTERTS